VLVKPLDSGCPDWEAVVKRWLLRARRKEETGKISHEWIKFADHRAAQIFPNSRRQTVTILVITPRYSSKRAMGGNGDRNVATLSY
jgi:hypothetical protein